MKRIGLSGFCLFLLVILPSLVFGQSAKDAVIALKKFQTKVETGISYRDYAPALSEAKFPSKLYLESKDALENQELSMAIKNTIKHYEAALAVWGIKFSGRGVDDYIGDDNPLFGIIQSEYPGGLLTRWGIMGTGKAIVIDTVLPVIWQKASNELEIASSLLSKAEAKTQANKDELETIRKEKEILEKDSLALKSEFDNLKGENERLKEERELLIKENETLKNEIENLKSKAMPSKKKR